MPAGDGQPRIGLMIVGAPKAGTTTLKSWLGQHPALVTHAAREFIFFADDQAYGQGYARAFRAQFGAAAAAGATPVAKSVAMMYSPAALERLKAHNPSVQVVLVLRDPVARAYSEYWYAKRRGREPAASFGEALERNARQPREDPTARDAYVARSRYADYLPALQSLFRPSQFSVLLLEDLERDPVAACRSLFARLEGVDPGFAPAVARRHNEAAAVRNPGLMAWMERGRRVPLLRGALRAVLAAPARKRLRASLMRLNEERLVVPPLDARTQSELDGYFAPSNEQLARLLGRSLEAWGGVSRRTAGKS